MKKCPTCGSLAEDSSVFCASDATRLVQIAQVFPSNDAKPSIYTSPSNAPLRQSPYRAIFFGALGMGVVLVVCASILWFLKSGNSGDPSSREFGQAAPESSNTETQKKTVILDEVSVKELIRSWERAQDEHDFSSYAELYADEFYGIKRTPSGREYRYGYTDWLKDRKKMSAGIVDVQVENVSVTIEGDTATAAFLQHFNHRTFNDIGRKVMKIKKYNTVLKIVFEEMRYSF